MLVSEHGSPQSSHGIAASARVLCGPGKEGEQQEGASAFISAKQ